MGIASVWSLRAAESGEGRFSREQVKGDIRLVLMSVSRTLVFPGDEPRELERSSKGVVSSFTVTYMIERLSDKPIQKTNTFGVEMSREGNKVEVTESRGTTHRASDYDKFRHERDFKKPPVKNEKQATVCQVVFYGVLPGDDPVDLVIKAGLDETVESFEFKSLPLP
jgi:hypothetical protein